MIRSGRRHTTPFDPLELLGGFFCLPSVSGKPYHDAPAIYCCEGCGRSCTPSEEGGITILENVWSKMHKGESGLLCGQCHKKLLTAQQEAKRGL